MGGLRKSRRRCSIISALSWSRRSFSAASAVRLLPFLPSNSLVAHVNVVSPHACRLPSARDSFATDACCLLSAVCCCLLSAAVVSSEYCPGTHAIHTTIACRAHRVNRAMGQPLHAAPAPGRLRRQEKGDDQGHYRCSSTGVIILILSACLLAQAVKLAWITAASLSNLLFNS